MDLSFTPAELAFRDEVRHFFRTEIPEKIRNKVLEGQHLSKDEIITSQRILNARGWAVPNWPKEWGGQDWSPVQVYMYQDEMQQAGVPSPLGFNTSMVGPVIAQFGTQAQKERFLPRAANLDDWWCQGFSEPGAGSDLAEPAHEGGARRRHLGDQRPEDVDHDGAARRLDFCPLPHRSRGEETGRHFLHPLRHEDEGHDRAPDPDHRRRPRGERGLLR